MNWLDCQTFLDNLRLFDGLSLDLSSVDCAVFEGALVEFCEGEGGELKEVEQDRDTLAKEVSKLEEDLDEKNSEADELQKQFDSLAEVVDDLLEVRKSSSVCAPQDFWDAFNDLAALRKKEGVT